MSDADFKHALREWRKTNDAAAASMLVQAAERIGLFGSAAETDGSVEAAAKFDAQPLQTAEEERARARAWFSTAAVLAREVALWKSRCQEFESGRTPSDPPLWPVTKNAHGEIVIQAAGALVPYMALDSGLSVCGDIRDGISVRGVHLASGDHHLSDEHGCSFVVSRRELKAALAEIERRVGELGLLHATHEELDARWKAQFATWVTDFPGGVNP